MATTRFLAMAAVMSTARSELHDVISPHLISAPGDSKGWPVQIDIALKTDDGNEAHEISACNKGVTIIVAPDGDDRLGDGSILRPFATLDRARRRVRELPATHGDVCVLLREGSYSFNSSFVLVPDDGGGPNRSVVYSSYAGERAVLEGGRQLTGWTTASKGSAGAPSIWSVPLRTPKGGFIPRQVWIGTDRVNESGLMAPNSVFGPSTLLSNADTVATLTGYITNNSAVVAAAAAHDAACTITGAGKTCATDVEFVYRRTRVQWEEDRLRVASWMWLPTGELNISFPAEGWKLRLMYTKGHDDFPTSIINLYSSLTTPGTGYVSTANDRVYYSPRPSDVMENMPPTWIPQFDGPLIAVRGERNALTNRSNPSHPPHYVERLTFAGLTLQHTTWGYPSGSAGYLDNQGGFLEGTNQPASSAWEIKTARNLVIRQCVVAHVGGGGLAIDEGSDGVSVADSFFFDSSCWGIRLGQTNDSGTAFDDWETRRTQNLSVHNSVVLGSGVELRGCPGLMGGYVRDSSITQNTITQAQWSGMTVGWGWSAPPTTALGRNRIIGNHVTHTNLATADGGPIYVLGAQGAGQSEMAHNFVGHAPHKCSFLYHDEGSSKWWNHDNVVDMPASDMPPICQNDFVCNEMPGHFDYIAAWASSERDIVIERITTRGLNQSNVYKGNNITVRSQTFLGADDQWPATAQVIVDSAGARLNWTMVGRGGIR